MVGEIQTKHAPSSRERRPDDEIWVMRFVLGGSVVVSFAAFAEVFNPKTFLAHSEQQPRRPLSRFSDRVRLESCFFLGATALRTASPAAALSHVPHCVSGRPDQRRG